MSTEDLRTASIPADAIITTFTSDGTLVLPAGAVDVGGRSPRQRNELHRGGCHPDPRCG